MRPKTGDHSRVAMTVWEAIMNTPEYYTVVVACISCLTIVGLMAVGAW